MSFLRDLRVAFYSLLRTKGLAITVVLTLALGIGANAAIFTLVRGVLLRPLVNRDEDRLIYIRQSAPGIGIQNANFSVPEIQDLRFEVMGLHPVLGRLLDAHDDGPNAAGAAVLTYRFWTTMLKSDPSVIGKQIRLGERSAAIVGVLEPSVPYPAETEIIANVVTSPHHLSATMVTGRVHRMTELFGRLAPGATLESANAELRTLYAGMIRQHPADYAQKGDNRIHAVRLRDQITSGARTILWVLLAASILVFIIACSNVANLILARSVRREGELAIRAAILLAFVPRLPSASASQGFGLASGGVRITGSTGRRLQVFAVTQIAASFMLLAGASMLIKTLLTLQATQTGFDMHRVLAMNVPVMSYGKTSDQIINFYREVIRRINEIPGVDRVALGTNVPWRDAGGFGPGFSFSGEGHAKGNREEDPRAQMRVVSPSFFAALGVPIVAGRDFNNNDRRGGEPVVIISQSVAQRMFPGQDPINRHVMWTDPVMDFIYITKGPRRVVGVAADVDDENVIPGAALTVYHPFGQIPDNETASKEIPVFGGRLFVHTSMDPYALVTPITRIVRDMAADQPVEHAATLEDIRAEVLTPDRLNTIVFGGFAAVALAIAIIGVAGVLAFSVSARTREFGIRLAVGSQPGRLLAGVIGQGAVMAGAGVVAGAALGYVFARVAGGYIPDVRMPSVLPVLVSALVLLAAAVVASAVPAARAARVDVIQALRSE